MSDFEIGFILLDELSTKCKKQCIETLIKIFRNIHHNPDEPKYRTLKLSNKRFTEEIWQYEGAKMIMRTAGWEEKEDSLILPSGVDVSEILNILITNRDIKPAESEWTEHNKVVGENTAKIREEELKKKALKEKEKQIKELKKDMAERKAIAERIVKEHHNDIANKKVTKPAPARPRAEGGCSKMSNHISKGG